MKTIIYTYEEKKVIITDGKVTKSDSEFCTVGQKPNTKALIACGWRLQKSPTIYYARGGTNSRTFSN